MKTLVDILVLNAVILSNLQSDDGEGTTIKFEQCLLFRKAYKTPSHGNVWRLSKEPMCQPENCLHTTTEKKVLLLLGKMENKQQKFAQSPWS